MVCHTRSESKVDLTLSVGDLLDISHASRQYFVHEFCILVKKWVTLPNIPVTAVDVEG